MDGVITDTADAHFAAWKAVFDDFLRKRTDARGNWKPFNRADYLAHVDGVPRFEGVRRFLAARGIELPEDGPDAAGGQSIHGLGNLKNRRFQERLREGKVPAYEDARELVSFLRRSGIRVGVFSASRNAARVLDGAGMSESFEALVDGTVAQELGLAGKPDPAMLVETARRLDSEPGETVVVEDAVSGVEAGARGRFALVVGINRQSEDPRAQAHALRTHGADLVLRDLRRLMTDDGSALRTVERLPSVWDRMDDLEARIGARRLALFLDYDGTLSPIVRDYRKAEISAGMAAVIGRLARSVPTAIISGRDLADVRERVGLEEVFYAGSHGFDIAGPGGLHDRPEQAERFLPPIAAARTELAKAVAGIEGTEIEGKTFSIAVHYRNTAAADVPRVEQAVDAVVGRHPELHKRRGKKVFELQPQADWDKGRAVAWLLENTRLGEGEALPLYIGDDLTDEDAFAVLEARGISIVVRGDDRMTLADFALEDTEDVRQFLERLAAANAEAER